MITVSDVISGTTRTLWTVNPINKADAELIDTQGWVPPPIVGIDVYYVGQDENGNGYYAYTPFPKPIDPDVRHQTGCPVCGVLQIGRHRKHYMTFAYICGYSEPGGYPCENTEAAYIRNDSKISFYRHGL